MNRWLVAAGMVAGLGAIASSLPTDPDSNLTLRHPNSATAAPHRSAQGPQQHKAGLASGQSPNGRPAVALHLARRVPSPIDGHDPFVWLERARAPEPVAPPPPVVPVPIASVTPAPKPTQRAEPPSAPALTPLPPARILGRVSLGNDESLWLGVDDRLVEAKVGREIDESRQVVELRRDGLSLRDSRNNVVEALEITTPPEGVVVR